MNLLDLLPVLGLVLCAAGVLIQTLMFRPAAKLAGLVLLYLGGSVLLLNVCSFQMCGALFVCGIGAAVLLGTSLREHPILPQEAETTREQRLFRLLLCLILCILSYSSSEVLRYWIPVHISILFVSLWTSLVSLLTLSYENKMLFRCICLQSLCFSFTLCYIYMENSIFVLAFLSALNLLLAFGSSVLSMGGKPEQQEEQSV